MAEISIFKTSSFSYANVTLMLQELLSFKSCLLSCLAISIYFGVVVGGLRMWGGRGQGELGIIKEDIYGRKGGLSPLSLIFSFHLGFCRLFQKLEHSSTYNNDCHGPSANNGRPESRFDGLKVQLV